MSIGDIGDRVKQLRFKRGVTQAELAARTQTSQQAIQQLEDGKVKRPRYLLELASALGCDASWLLTGKGSPNYKENKNNGDEIPPESEWGSVDVWDSKTTLNDDEVEVPFLKDIEFACGNGSLNDEDYNGFKLRISKATLRRVGARSDGSSVICFPARGDSMEPFIPDGSTVAINCDDKKIIDGKVYAVNQDGWKRLKVLYRVGPDRVSLRSFNNAAHPDEEHNLSDVEIIGRLFWTSVMW
ncbi:XRE family transcriptional regulator [Serratia fonticola]|uniref:XRE family transcriptional regulator n=1 Tax=Serratia fonticola TaxID=47917 RepID=UPI00093DEC44|nr:helix-turn-helix transcriptional regulator [Serratia fonticola]OKP31334.1 phage repressor protein [Serratia fonticola]